MPEALIWGASGGIGAALTRHLKAQGWTVYGAARTEDKAPSEQDLIVSFDAGRPDSIAQAVYSIAQQTNKVDLVVYAAGGLISSPLEKLSPEDWRAIMDANLNGAFYAINASLNLLTDGHVMVLGAYVDKVTFPRMGAYVSAKAALEPLVTIFQKENRKFKFTLVRLPAVDTDFWQNVPFKKPETALSPDEVARAIEAHYQQGASGTLDIPHG